MGSLKKRQWSRYIAAVITLGLFSVAPVAYALPVQDTTHSNTTGTGINTVGHSLGENTLERIFNGTSQQDILLGDTPDTKTIFIKGGSSYTI